MFKSVSIFLIAVFCAMSSHGLTNGPVLKNSLEERLISKAFTEVLTTPTGCRIAESFFLLKEKPLSHYFGINSEAAKTIAETCPGKDLPKMSFRYSIQATKRPAKNYTLSIDDKNENFHGWTSANNTTHIFLKYYDPILLRRILTHELLITMDDKFNLQTQGFAKLGIPTNLPSQVSCQVDRFLTNPYHQSLLASLRAFRMELIFASELNDKAWSDELQSYDFLSDNAVENFESFEKVMQPFLVSIMRFYTHYHDDCTSSKIPMAELSDQDLRALAARDWLALKKTFPKASLENLMTFLIMQMAISSSDSNAVNSGPRPVIGTGGWSNQQEIKLPSTMKITIPQKDLINDRSQSWEIYHRDRYEKILKTAPQTFTVPSKKDSDGK